MKRFRLWLWWLWNGRERLQMAWDRIEGLERLCSSLENRCMEADRARMHVIEQLESRAEECRLLQKQLDDLRRLVTARQAEKPPETIRARNWREVQHFIGDNIDA